MTTRHVPRRALGAALLIASVGCAGTEGARLPMAPCRLDGLAESVQCGRVDVPEDRSNPGSRTIPIRVAVVPALARTPDADPLFVLAGGPGQAATSYAPWAATVFRKLRRSRDLVLVDVRGTAESNALHCAMPRNGDLLPVPDPAHWRACREALASDPRLYWNGPAVEDLDAALARIPQPKGLMRQHVSLRSREP